MPNWRLASSLKTLLEQINDLAPTRSKLSDGTIGDQAHSQRDSDHNPNAAGVVTAVDITHDPKNGVDARTLAHSVLQDSRTKYVIFAGKIWKARTGQWETYRGVNPHNKHVHISVSPTPSSYDSTAPWSINLMAQEDVSQPALRLGDRGEAVRTLQSRLNLRKDGIFGPKTEAAVKSFQNANKLRATGVVDSNTWRLLRSK